MEVVFFFESNDFFQDILIVVYIEYVFCDYEDIVVGLFLEDFCFFDLFFEVFNIIVFKRQLFVDVYVNVIVDISVVVFVVYYDIFVCQQGVYDGYDVLVVEVEQQYFFFVYKFCQVLFQFFVVRCFV